MGAPSPTSLFAHILHPQKRAFLLAYIDCFQVTKAARHAGVSHQLHYYWRQADPVYAEALEAARQLAIEGLEDVAIQRARDEDRPSDTLMIFLLKGALPDKYRDNVKVETDITIHLETSLQQGVKRLELLRGDSDRTRIA